MKRKTFLSLCALVACSIGAISLFAPQTLLVDMKFAEPSGAAVVMARTVGVLLISFGVLNFLVRGHGDTATMGSILQANLLLQMILIPIDPLAYHLDVYASAMSFIPNTILHVLLAAGFCYFLVDLKRRSAVVV